MDCCISSLAVYALGIALLLYVLRRLIEAMTIGDLPSRPVLITGCDTGFGHRLALKLAAEGMPVFAACLTQEGVDLLAASSRHLRGNIDAFLMNVTSDESVAKAVVYVEGKEGGGLWGVVNNAGILGPIAPDDWLTVKHYEMTLSVNTLGVIRVAQAFTHLVKRRQGRIVNTSSIAGLIAFPTTGPYCLSKFAVESYSDTLRLELAPFCVSVITIEPGFFKTNLMDAKKAAEETRRIYAATSQQTKDEYGDAFVDSMEEQRTHKMNTWVNPNIDLVVDAYVTALTSVWPRARMPVGFDAVYAFSPLSVMPTCVQDMFFRLMMIVGKQVMPAGAPRKSFWW